MKYSRFSPGYGDFVLENQKIFFDLLEMREAGISLSKTFQLIPEKTVTAITGLK
jgi:cobalamin-dependent methionine synthase I